MMQHLEMNKLSLVSKIQEWPPCFRSVASKAGERLISWKYLKLQVRPEKGTRSVDYRNVPTPVSMRLLQVCDSNRFTHSWGSKIFWWFKSAPKSCHNIVTCLSWAFLLILTKFTLIVLPYRLHTIGMSDSIGADTKYHAGYRYWPKLFPYRREYWYRHKKKLKKIILTHKLHRKCVGYNHVKTIHY